MQSVNKNILTQPFSFDKKQPFYKLLGKKDILLRRALFQKNVMIDFLADGDGKPTRWVAQGKDKAIVFKSTMPAHSSLKAVKITRNKIKTKEMLDANGVRTPKGITLKSSEIDKAHAWFDTLVKKKAVVKPISGSGGKGITSSITTKEQLSQALESINPATAVLEEHIDGQDHRILVAGGNVIAAMRRWPAHIVGDGNKTVTELISDKNKERSKNPYDGRYLLKLTPEIVARLQKMNITPETVLSAEQRVDLQTIANIGAGGEGEDVTSIIHPDFVEIARKSWEAFDDLECCGVDLIVDDISKPAESQSYSVIEMNANCDIPIHHWPTIGEPLDVAAAIADYYFPDDKKELDHCAKIIISGKVQKVNFRRWIAKQALIYGVSGYCKNSSNNVEALFQGSKTSVDAIIRLCAKGPEKALVEKISYIEAEEKATPIFEIR
ncbi:acylphosphatase [Halomonas sp. AOP43-D1-39]|uniref:acylphosphatase n=1 Tax=unclassified Halomonas TaxID=2609666 RepID=UPI0040344A1D